MKPENYKIAVLSKSVKEFSETVSKGCAKCTLSRHGSGPIIYRGNPEAPILLIGEAPGLVEEREREPFTGPAGKLLDKIIEVTCGLDTNKDICLSNVAYCRPTAENNSGRQNYTPKQDQLNHCKPFLKKFIKLVSPKVIIACGRTALCQLVGDTKMRIGAWEGKWLVYEDNTPMFVMTHPAAILHQGSWPEEQYRTKKKVKEYMQYFGETWRDKC